MPDSSTVNLQSMMSTKPDVKDNSITIPFVKDGTTAFNGAGKKFTITSEALENDHTTWQGGIVTVNHKVKEKGLISKTWYDSPFAYAEIIGLSDEAMSIVQSPAYRGVSQESTSITTDKNGNVTKLKGTGITLVVYPEKPACDMGAGCGELIASALVGSDSNDYIKVDVAVKNNSENMVKIRDETIYLEQNEMLDTDLFKQRLADNIGYMGLGTYYIFEHDSEMKIGDEYLVDIEPAHTVEITVSTDESNPHINTQNSNLELTSTRGTEIMTDETDKGAIEALKSENEALKTKSTALGSEIVDLKSQLVESGKLKDTEITDLKSTIKEKDEIISKSADNLETAIKSALEAHDASITEKQAFDGAVTELKSVMKDEPADKFLETKPSIEQIQSMVSALKDAQPNNEAGAGAGTESGTDGDITSTGATTGVYTPGKGYEV
ncbi:MAG: hypothetical protein KAS66_02840 [Candidatus Omnitrophica bacterium]|nr:hypothetical protein [Candidatus Omnitrophota bacterium]